AGAPADGGPGASGHRHRRRPPLGGEELSLHGGHLGRLGGLPVRPLYPGSPSGVPGGRGGSPPHGCARRSRSRPGLLTYGVRMADTADFLDAREKLLRDGYRRLWVQGEVRPLEGLSPAQAMGPTGWAEVVVDRLALEAKALPRLSASLEEAWARGAGAAALWVDGVRSLVRQGLACPGCGRGFEAASPGLFSY